MSGINQLESDEFQAIFTSLALCLFDCLKRDDRQDDRLVYNLLYLFSVQLKPEKRREVTKNALIALHRMQGMESNYLGDLIEDLAILIASQNELETVYDKVFAYDL